jgi:hypothetical protein
MFVGVEAQLTSEDLFEPFQVVWSSLTDVDPGRREIPAEGAPCASNDRRHRRDHGHVSRTWYPVIPSADVHEFLADDRSGHLGRVRSDPAETSHAVERNSDVTA